MATKTQSKPQFIRFADDLIPLIHNGEKWKTYRFGEKYGVLESGDVLDLVKASDDSRSGKIKITSKYWCKLKDIPLQSLGHEEYKNSREMLKQFRKYYSEEVDLDSKFLILSFCLTKS